MEFDLLLFGGGWLLVRNIVDDTSFKSVLLLRCRLGLHGPILHHWYLLSFKLLPLHEVSAYVRPDRMDRSCFRHGKS